MIGNIIGGVIFILLGMALTISLVYNSFVVPDIPKSDRWQRIRVKQKGEKAYIAKNVSDTRLSPPFSKKSEHIISYTVNGVTYEKTVPDGKITHIFIKKSNPNYFKTTAEIRAAKCKNKAEKISTVVEIFISLCFVVLGAFIISNQIC